MLWCWPALSVLVASCSGGHLVPTPPAARPAGANVATSIFLVGDAGEPDPAGEPVLQALEREIAGAGDRSVVAFLGDNIYPGGMPDSTSPIRSESERRIEAQIAVLRSTGAQGVFLPGNHDWADGGQDGWAAVQRQEAYVRRSAGDRAKYLPGNGCPGPEVLDVGDQVRLILLDTQWWLHDGPRPAGPASDCPTDTESQIGDSLRAALRGAGSRHTLVLAHHPLVSTGPHGGHFDWTDHIFPLHNLVSWLWLPLPVIGSIYPIVRGSGVSPQDMGNSRNEGMRKQIEAALTEHPVLVYGSGHDHNLQVFKGSNARFLLVSGGGFFGRPYPVGHKRGMMFAMSAKGFMRLDVLVDGRVRLGVFAVHGPGAVQEEFSAWLMDSTHTERTRAK